MAKGYKTGGRKKGTPNKATNEFLAAIRETGLDHHRMIALYALDKVPCSKCKSTGRVLLATFMLAVGASQGADKEAYAGRVLSEDAKGLSSPEAPCPYCAGTGIKPLPPAESVKALITILDRDIPRRAALQAEISGGPEPIVLVSLAGRKSEEIAQAVEEVQARREAEADDEGE